MSTPATGRVAATPGQTVGPFFHDALPYAGGPDLVPPGRGIRFTGVVRDGAGAPVPDALIEIWQPAPDGTVVQASGSLHRDGWTFTGFGRAATDREGRYTFSTLEPGPLAPGAAPYLAVCVFARGLLDRLFTRAYLPDDPEALARDRVLSSVPEHRRGSLLAARDQHGLTFDIRLQGEGETVFLSYGEA